MTNIWSANANERDGTIGFGFELSIEKGPKTHTNEPLVSTDFFATEETN